MILITDAGSTSSTHVYLQNGKEIKRVSTGPINPFHHSLAEIKATLKQLSDDNFHPDEVLFFGAGCKGIAQIEKMRQALAYTFDDAIITVNSDLMAACLACYGKTSGLIGILGTGSILGYYNGRDLEEISFASGYLFGDECSGYHLSQQFLADYFKDNLPETLTLAFAERQKKNKAELLSFIYKSDNLKTTVASFTPFLKENIRSEYVINLVTKSFDAFLEQRKSLLTKSTDISLVGTVAWNFKDLFSESINKHNLQLRIIHKEPMEALMDFYLR